MFNTISWTEYLTAIALFTGGYYIVVLAVFYRQEILHLLTGKREISPNSNNEDRDPSFEGLEEVVTDVRGILKEAGKEADKSVLLEQLKLRLANFAGLRQPAFRTALKNYIVTQAFHFCGIMFSTEELSEILGPPDS